MTCLQMHSGDLVPAGAHNTYLQMHSSRLEPAEKVNAMVIVLNIHTQSNTGQWLTDTRVATMQGIILTSFYLKLLFVCLYYQAIKLFAHSEKKMFVQKNVCFHPLIRIILQSNLITWCSVCIFWRIIISLQQKVFSSHYPTFVVTRKMHLQCSPLKRPTDKRPSRLSGQKMAAKTVAA